MQEAFVLGVLPSLYPTLFYEFIYFVLVVLGQRKWVERNGSNRPPVPWVESSPFRNWVEWTWVDLEKCQVQGRQHIDFEPSPFDPIRPQSIRPKLFDQKGRPNSFRPISFDPFHAIRCILSEYRHQGTF